MNFAGRVAAVFRRRLLAPAVGAQTYPAKPVRVVIPWPPGGSNDIVGRIVVQKMSEQLGQQFVIDNRGGAAGTIGSEVVAKSPPDGYTIMVHSATHVANPHLYKKLPYDTLKDFVGVAPLAPQVGMLVVHPSLPVKTVKEFIALAQSAPGPDRLRLVRQRQLRASHDGALQLDDRHEDDPRAVQGRRPGGDRDRVGRNAGDDRDDRLGHPADQSRARAAARGHVGLARRRSFPTCRRSRKPACRATNSPRGSALSRRPARRSRSSTG